MVPSFCNAHVSVPYYAMLQMPKTFHMGNIKCILQDKIQNKLLYLTAARVNSLNTWQAFILNMKQKKENIIVCMAKQEESNNLWFMLSSLWNVLIFEHTLVCCGIHSSQKQHTASQVIIDTDKVKPRVMQTISGYKYNLKHTRCRYTYMFYLFYQTGTSYCIMLNNAVR